ncbi:MAG: hypothetical protein P4L55_13375 [Syntrophobacteraceae bacterium]|nr:hypothetical protein [Syntrophobacteraceae bacterium]
MSRRACFIILAAITLLIRFPFFFPEVDLDESTFILVGHELLKGHLPYVTLWDVKPPLLYFFYAALQLMAKSIPMIRLAGAFCVMGAAWFVFLIGEKVRNRRTGLISALLLIVYATLTGDGATTSSEVVAILPFSAAAFLCLGEDLAIRDFFLAGLLISTACMFRLNLAYVGLLGCVFLVHPRFVSSSLTPVRRLAAYALGGAVPVVLSLIPYLIAGKVDLLYDTCIRAALAYSNFQGTPPQVLLEHLSRFGNWHYFLLNSLILLSFCGGLLSIGLGWRTLAPQTQKRLLTILAFMLATGASILKSGAAYEQYLIQLLPFTAVIAACFMDWVIDRGGAAVLCLACAAWLVVPGGRVINAYRPVIARAAAHKPLSYGPGYNIASYLKKVNPDNRPVFMMEEAIVYWLNGGRPLSRMSAHPYNIGKEFLLHAMGGPSDTPRSELVKVFSQKPLFVVKPLCVRYLSGHPDALKFLSDTLFDSYVLVQVIGDYQVYQRFS